MTGAAFAGVGNYFSSTGNTSIATTTPRYLSKTGVAVRNFTSLGRTLKTVAHGIVGGLSSKLSGGSFSKSFLSTAFVQAFSPGIDKIGINAGGAGVIQRVGAAALLGGVASKIIGGSFSMGARLGAMSRFFNDEFHIKFGGKLGTPVRKLIEWVTGNKIPINGGSVGLFVTTPGSRVGLTSPATIAASGVKGDFDLGYFVEANSSQGLGIGDTRVSIGGSSADSLDDFAGGASTSINAQLGSSGGSIGVDDSMNLMVDVSITGTGVNISAESSVTHACSIITGNCNNYNE